jgi:agmatine deiminase
MPRLINSAPKNDGFYMPAEYASHRKTWMLWPQRSDNWRNNGKPAQAAFSAVAKAIARFEPVTIGVNPDQLAAARQFLPANIQVVVIPNDDAWMRDCGPTFVVDRNGSLRAIDWIFNAWGGSYNGLYSSWDLDEGVAPRVFDLEAIDYYQAPIVLEGGSIHVDGEGTCLTTAECQISPGRNPGLSQDQIEGVLKQYLNVETVLWIPRGVFNDETSGHVDNIACFIRPGEIALTWTNDQSDPQYDRSSEAYDYLMSVTDAQNRRLVLTKIHQPDPILLTQEEADGVVAIEGTLPRKAGDRMAASYVNFYFCNGAAIIPTFGDRHDNLALQTYRTLMPDRQIVGVPSREILLGGGNIHCITQQEPGNIVRH